MSVEMCYCEIDKPRMFNLYLKSCYNSEQFDLWNVSTSWGLRRNKWHQSVRYWSAVECRLCCFLLIATEPRAITVR